MSDPDNALLAACIHEAAHVAAALACGSPEAKLSLYSEGAGGQRRIVPRAQYRPGISAMGNAIVAFAGLCGEARHEAGAPVKVADVVSRLRTASDTDRQLFEALPAGADRMTAANLALSLVENSWVRINKIAADARKKFLRDPSAPLEMTFRADMSAK